MSNPVPFTYEMKGRTMTMSYYEVPPDVLENAFELVGWADRAIQGACFKNGFAEEKRKLK